jgi:sigma-54 dependent transcriptional regulator, acetoin dehydrogenase operon transcriptional activator AcoR
LIAPITSSSDANKAELNIDIQKMPIFLDFKSITFNVPTNIWEALLSNGDTQYGEILESLFDSPLEAKLWFVSILDSINDGILIADEHSIVRYINPEYTRITNVTPDQIINKYLIDVRPGAMLPQVVARGVRMDGVYRKENNVEYVVDMAPIIINDRVVGGVSIVKNITEVKQLFNEISRFEKKNRQLKKIVAEAYKARYFFEDLVGESLAVQKSILFAKKVSSGEADLLITGESGTGKEIFAQAIHNESQRRHGCFVALNCASLTSSLAESELFGYEEGAFTGAQKGGKVGLFEIANGGTVFLDEIGELSLEIQAKLLRTLQERMVRKVGESTEVPIDVRIIASTNRDLQKMISEGRFRNDLYYRLNVINIHLPPLREREKDACLIGDHFLDRLSRKTGKSFRFSSAVYDFFSKYSWPGNIRELKNIIEFATTICDETEITHLHLPSNMYIDADTGSHTAKTLVDLIQDTERQIVLDVLKNSGLSVEGKKKAAAQLGISLATLYNKIRGFKNSDAI